MSDRIRIDARRWWAGLVLLAAAAAAQAEVRPAAVPARQDEVGFSAMPSAASTASMTAAGADIVRVLLVADRETTLSSPVTARIEQLQLSLGATFSAGQILVGFDCQEARARLTMARAELAGAVEAHEGKIRMQGLEQASEVEVALAASAAAKARGQVELQKAQVAQCTIKAPWAGRVAKVHVRPHMSVTPGQPMVDLVKSGPLRLRLNAPSRMLVRLRVGSAFNVAIDETGRSYEARVMAVNSRVDPVSQTIELEAAVSKEHAELLPGMSGVADLGSLR
ncbi:efflux RND transporter periplasmic adaptor subunit [Ramlibacter tataouinensis]|uniref:Uncharacterized protein n=1 Tax=Ramlibacter tataouinensis (strain ATCC BAA-407 / DSM 14655 / LMG 21543 / TTB310) TaxID=365046 RepID=F5Y0H4_RAMTT|nr:HlyD family efflux transporter periplasmic adaptor subunit [Ramlibacter tataouinensis]AEG93380.1 Conserved hypothetical protein [Ramlibacter tataouinensis TTB310]